MAGSEREGMDKILIALFEERDKAHEAARILRDLDAAGSIDLFASSVLATRGGDVVVLDAADEGPLGRAVRLFTDRFRLALAGSPQDLVRVGVGEDLVHDVTRRLRPGGSVLVAELWEQWVQPVDAQLSTQGAVVLRRAREDILLADIERERASLEAERADLERHRARAARNDDDALEHRIDAVDDAIRAVRDHARAALVVARAEHEAKMAVLIAKLEVARGPLKDALDARISGRLAEHRHRTMALMRAAI